MSVKCLTDRWGLLIKGGHYDKSVSWSFPTGPSSVELANSTQYALVHFTRNVPESSPNHQLLSSTDRRLVCFKSLSRFQFQAGS